MSEINTGGENRKYGLGCLPFIVFIILIFAAVILIFLLILNMEIRVFDVGMNYLEEFYRFLSSPLIPGSVSVRV
jgi:hypothetical protein